MLSQAKKLFRFGFPAGTIVIVLAILLCSSGHEGVVQESCPQAASALMKEGGLRELSQESQDQFFVNLLDCSTVIHKQIPEAPKSDNCETFKAIIPNDALANVIDVEIEKVIVKPTNLATKERLVLLSVYLVFLCHETGYCSCRVANLSSVIKHQKHRQKLQRLLSDLELILDYLNLELMPKWKSDNTTILKNNSDTLIKMLNQFSTRLKKLSEEAFDDVYQNSESFLWRVLSTCVPIKDLVVLVGVGFCVMWLPSPPFIMIVGGGAGVYFLFFSTLFYTLFHADKFSSETVSQLKADTDALHDKIVNLKTAMERPIPFYEPICRYFC